MVMLFDSIRTVSGEDEPGPWSWTMQTCNGCVSKECTDNASGAGRALGNQRMA